MKLRVVVSLLAGIALAVGIAACGEDREGGVTIEGGSTGSTGGTGTTTTPTTPTTPTTGTTEEQSAAPAAPDQTVTVTADPDGDLRFTKGEITVQAGVVKFVLKNPSTLPHALEIEGMGVEEETATIRQNGTADVTVNLEKPGEYKFYCPVGNHEDAGMTGALTVQ